MLAPWGSMTASSRENIYFQSYFFTEKSTQSRSRAVLAAEEDKHRWYVGSRGFAQITYAHLGVSVLKLPSSYPGSSDLGAGRLPHPPRLGALPAVPRPVRALALLPAVVRAGATAGQPAQRLRRCSTPGVVADKPTDVTPHVLQHIRRSTANVSAKLALRLARLRARSSAVEPA